MDEKKDGIREIHIPEEIRRMSAAEVLANPPKFPLINGINQIVGRLIELTIERKLQWYKYEFSPGSYLYGCAYKSYWFDVAGDMIIRDMIRIGTCTDIFGDNSRTSENFASQGVSSLIEAILASNVKEVHSVAEFNRRDRVADTRSFLEKIWYEIS